MKDDSYKAKLERAEYEMYVKKIARKQSHPLLFKFARMIGIEVRPPHYATAESVFVFCTCYITLLVAALLLFVQKDAENISAVSIAIKAVPVGVIFGIIMMFLNIENKKKYELTPWDEV